MATLARAAFALSACLGTSGCYDVLGPVDAQEVTITYAVTGGFAGVDYDVVVDGAARRARISCRLGCGPSATQTELPISAAQVDEIARALDESGILGMDGTDFGDECCDQFHIDLTYVRGAREAHVRGTQSLLPAALHPPIALLSALSRSSVPAIVSPQSRAEDWPREPYVLGDVQAGSLTLTAEVTYSGGCADHRMDLVLWGGWMESFPVQINALITHEDGDDPCDAIVSETRSFDLFPLAQAYAEAYGEIGSERPTVILRLWDPVSGSPVGRLIEVVL